MTGNADQTAHWNGAEAEHWVANADRYDAQLAPFTDALFDRLRAGRDDVVLDVGCGAGATSLEAHARGARSVVGIDISGPLLAVASRRAGEHGVADRVKFVAADAQLHPFEPAVVAAVVSRFGLMFFDDPVAAFGNLGRALRPGGRLCFVCWQPLDANPWLLVPGLAAAAHVPLPALERDGGPGMFSLADPQRIEQVLTAAGFRAVTIEACTPDLVLGGGGTVAETVAFMAGTGIARVLFDGAPRDAVDRALDAITGAFESAWVPGVGVVLGAGAWLVSAIGRN